jgi:hypothetical protein
LAAMAALRALVLLIVSVLLGIHAPCRHDASHTKFRTGSTVPR